MKITKAVGKTYEIYGKKLDFDVSSRGRFNDYLLVLQFTYISIKMAIIRTRPPQKITKCAVASTFSSEIVVYLGSTGGKTARVGSGILIELDLPSLGGSR